ncbi:MAG: hypothetical protein P4L53_24675, partial [Candidatus Obscuribacterales bacterium]|nr:hypothetical protein [Candidatus Obscuribacterales bacterium]
MANPAVDDVSTRVEPTKPNNPLAPTPLEQAGKPVEVAKDSTPRFEEQLASRTLPEKGASDQTAQANQRQAQQSEGISPGTPAKVNDLVGTKFTNKDGTTFVTKTGDTYDMKVNSDNVATLTPRAGDGSVVSGKLERGPSPIAESSDSKVGSLSQTDASKKFTDPSTTDFKVTGVDAVTPAARSENVRPESDGQGRTEAGQTGPKANLPDAPAPLNSQKTAQEANAPVISGVISRSDASRATKNTDTGELRPPSAAGANDSSLLSKTSADRLTPTADKTSPTVDKIPAPVAVVNPSPLAPGNPGAVKIDDPNRRADPSGADTQRGLGDTKAPPVLGKSGDATLPSAPASTPAPDKLTPDKTISTGDKNQPPAVAVVNPSPLAPGNPGAVKIDDPNRRT